MCDEDIHVGVVADPKLSRRAFGVLSAAAAGAATVAQAALPVSEREVDIKTADGTADAFLAHPNGKGPWPAVLIWPDIFGLRPVFRDMARRLAAEGYVVLVPNPFYRSGRKGPPIDGPMDFSKPEVRDTLMGLRAALTSAATGRDAAAYVAFLDAQPQTDKKARVGVQGYCMGGPLCFYSAAAVPARFGAVASFHGGGLATDAPDSPHKLVDQTKAQYLVAVADNDDEKNPDEKVKVKAALDAAKLQSKVEVYEGAMHGWCVPGSQAYNAAAAEKAWSELLSLYARALKG